MFNKLFLLSFLFILFTSVIFAVHKPISVDHKTNESLESEIENIYQSLNDAFFALNPPHAHICDTTTQSIADTTKAQVITFNTNSHLYKINHSTGSNTSKIYVSENGSYLISYVAQINLASGANSDIEIWLRVNGVDVANTDSRSHITNTNEERILTGAYIVEMNANDYVELAMTGQSTGNEIFTVAAGVNPTRPAIPSIVFNINKVESKFK